MGSWGYDIFEDDFALDLKTEFEDFLDDGLSPIEAINMLLNEYVLEDKDDDEYPIFYLVIASLQVEHDCLQDEVKKEALYIINQDIGMDVWKEEGMEEYTERKKVLENLKEKLN